MGVYGQSDNVGVFGASNNIAGEFVNGVHPQLSSAVYLGLPNYLDQPVAAIFKGQVEVTGKLFKDGGGFKMEKKKVIITFVACSLVL
jgi:hypothetical protein